MARMSGTAMAACTGQATSMSAFSGNRTQLSISRCQQRVRYARGEIKALVGLSSGPGSKSDWLGSFGRDSSASSAVLRSDTRLRFCSREGSGFAPMIKSRPSSGVVVAQAGKNSIQAPERILAALGYVLPFFDGIQYGRYFFLQFPIAESLLRPLYPLLAAYKGFPYSNFIAFFSLYLLVVRNPSISRYVRFNAMQAVVLDVLLILPTLVERTFAPRGGWGFDLLIIFYNSVFLFLVSCFLFGVVSCILGKTPRLPIVADAADAQV